MPAPIPSKIRVIRIYQERAPMRSRNLVGPTTRYKFPEKHPSDDNDPWWIDATGWLTDPTGYPWDRLGQVAVPPPSAITDTALSITSTVLSDDGLQAGIYFAGGTPGAKNWLRFILTGAMTGAQKGVDVLLRIENVAPVRSNPPQGYATANGSVVTIGGIAYPLSGSSE